MSSIHVSPLNQDPEVKKRVKANSVTLCDVTLRDGELAVPGSFSLPDYIKIATLLDELGVPQIQVSYPGMYPWHKEAAKALKREGIKAKLEVKVPGTAGNWRHQIEDCIETGADQVSLQFMGCSPQYQRIWDPDWEEQRHLDAMQAAVLYGRERGANMEVTATDGSRGEIPFLLKYYQAAQEAGAVGVRLNESCPAMSPVAFGYMVGELRSSISVTFGVHCHNHWGLSLANACAAVEAGADLVDVCVNNLAGHAGNVALDEALLTFKYLYGFDIPIATEGLMELSKVLEEISGIRMPANKPIVGRNVFAHSGHHGARALTERAMEPFPPELVGNTRRSPLQWDATDTVIRYNLEAVGIDPTGVDVPSTLAAVREFSRREKREMHPEEFVSLVRQ